MPKPDDFQTIDPAALTNVAGGKATSSSSSDSSAVMSALTGILDSLGSLASSRQNSGFGAQEMMLFMMMMQQRTAVPTMSTAHAPAPSWTWDANGGYWIVK